MRAARVRSGVQRSYLRGHGGVDRCGSCSHIIPHANSTRLPPDCVAQRSAEADPTGSEGVTMGTFTRALAVMAGRVLGLAAPSGLAVAVDEWKRRRRTDVDDDQEDTDDWQEAARRALYRG